MAKNDYIIKLPTLREPTSKSPENAREIIKTWTQAFEKVLTNNVKDGLSTVFREDAWIRDFLSLSWDFRTINGLDEITAFFKENQPRAGLRQIVPREKGAFQPSFGDPAPGVHWVESMFDFESNVGRGKGMVRLALEADDTWKAFMINFTLLQLKGFEEKMGVSRPTGHVDPKGGNWKERRERQVEFVDEDPTVLVIGAGELHILDADGPGLLTCVLLGHAGLNIGVRLQNLGLPTLLIDRNEHVGDSWRKRYRVSLSGVLTKTAGA